MTLLGHYVSESEKKVQMIASKKILLAGQSGETPVSVQNGLSQPVQVQVTALTPPGSQLQVGTFNPLLTVPAGKTGTVRIPVHSSDDRNRHGAATAGHAKRVAADLGRGRRSC